MAAETDGAAHDEPGPGARSVLPDDLALSIDGFCVDKTAFDIDHYRFIYTSIWHNMERENTLIHYRLSWSLLMTAGFITAESYIAKAILDASGRLNILVYLGLSSFFLAFMSLAALYVAIRAKLGVDAAIKQLSYLKSYYLRTTAGGKNLFEGYMGLPRPFGNQTGHRSGNYASKSICPVLLLFWTIVACIEVIVGVVLIAKA